MTNPWQNLIKPLRNGNYSAILANKDSVLKFYWAVDFYENKIFLLQLSQEVQKIKNIEEILGIKIVFDVVNGTQQLSFVLSDLANEDMFYLICSDLLEKTKSIENEQKAIEVLLYRLDSWRKFLKSKRKVLDKRGVIGLVGELCFLKNELFPRFGIKESLSFWQATLQEKQDFIVHNTAIEVKTRGTQNKITVSSFGQLNSELENLYLYVLTITESRKRFDDNGYDRHKVFLYKEDFNKFIKALGEAIDYVKTDLMPDFDFDAFNHEYPENENGDVVVTEEITTPKVAEVTDTNINNNLSSEEVDKW